jgi:prevent-host-death family protein
MPSPGGIVLMNERARSATVTVSLEDAEARLPALVERAAAGEEIVIEKAGKPRARLVATDADGGRKAGAPSPLPPRPLGMYRDVIRIGPDFDDPLPEEIMRYFRGEGD